MIDVIITSVGVGFLLGLIVALIVIAMIEK